MSDYYLAAALCAAAYLCGSLPTGLLLGRARGVDVRTRGSGNIGATNVTRLMGRAPGALVLVIDAAKGALPIILARALGYPETVDPFVITACGVLAIAGHCFPVWLDFRGGKGVATTLGVLLGAAPLLAALCVALFSAIYLAWRRVSLASISAALATPALAWILDAGDEVLTLGIAAALIVVAKHHGNIRRLLSGEEAAL